MQFQIQNLKYEIENDLLKLKDSNDENYIIINLNQMYNMELKKDLITIYLDNDSILKIS